MKNLWKVATGFLRNKSEPKIVKNTDLRFEVTSAAPNNLIAQGWRGYIVKDPKDPQIIRIALGHSEMNTYSNVCYDIKALNVGIEIDIGKMMDVAMGIKE